ncbi:MAG TPA: hypothetical protein VK191_12890 [Symbiobacteriaceae bacterium]|nr:hypothetical protein [Symbiobacteriaceae bacterium]
MSNPSPTIRFFDNTIPPLEAETYTITIDQAITGIDTGSYFQPITQLVEVRAPQFTLPANAVHALYPPDKSNGIYGEILPHIVLDDRSLPWERYLTASDKSIPWLALLLFEAAELQGATVQLTTVADLLTADPNGKILKPGIDPQSLSTEILNSNCQTITVSATVFQALVPQLAELKYLTHVREVDNAGDAVETGWFSALVANRFPLSTGTDGAAGGQNLVHLISLEGWAKYLDGTALPDGASLQLVTLANWSFISAPAADQSFAQLMANFVTQEGGDPSSILLQLPVSNPPANPTPAQAAALKRLNDGYLPLSYKTALGEESFAWYRGPLAPVVAPTLPTNGSPITASDEVMIYDQASGVFDQSYAAAWEIGRAVALADKSFGTTLMNYRRATYQLLHLIVDRLQLAGLADPADLQQLAQSDLVRQSFDKLLSAGLGNHLTEAFASLNASSGAPGPAQPVKAVSSQSVVQVLQTFLADPNVQTFLQATVQTELIPVAQWLANLRRLVGVPFNHLVPDQRMLPVESLRFFYVDPNWLDALTDGALSIGTESSRDLLLHQVMKGVMADAIAQAVPSGPISGLLIRSELISGWPGLVVKAEAGGTTLTNIRQESLSPKVLIALFQGIPDLVTLSEPLQGLRFGVEDGDLIQLRSLVDPIGQPLGKTFPTSGGFAQYFRPVSGTVGNRVLQINDGPTSLVPQLTAAFPGVSTFGPADLALQMVKAPERQSFLPPKEAHHG